jgi:DnaJ-class molecular chaperone
LPSNASKEQVKTRYRELMRSRHPDQGGSQEDAANLNMARSVLLDDEV